MEGGNLAPVPSIFAGSSVLGHGWAKRETSAFLTISCSFLAPLSFIFLFQAMTGPPRMPLLQSTHPKSVVSKATPEPERRTLQSGSSKRLAASRGRPVATEAPLNMFASRCLSKSLQTLSGCSSSTQEGRGSVPTQSNALVASSALLPSG